MHCNLLQNICLQHSEGPFFKKHSKIQSFCHPIILAVFGKLLKTEYRFLLHAFKFIYFNYTINCNLPYYFLKHMITIQVNLVNENTINFPIMNCFCCYLANSNMVQSRNSHFLSNISNKNLSSNCYFLQVCKVIHQSIRFKLSNHITLRIQILVLFNSIIEPKVKRQVIFKSPKTKQKWAINIQTITTIKALSLHKQYPPHPPLHKLIPPWPYIARH